MKRKNEDRASASGFGWTDLSGLLYPAAALAGDATRDGDGSVCCDDFGEDVEDVLWMERWG